MNFFKGIGPYGLGAAKSKNADECVDCSPAKHCGCGSPAKILPVIAAAVASKVAGKVADKVID